MQGTRPHTRAAFGMYVSSRGCLRRHHHSPLATIHQCLLTMTAGSIWEGTVGRRIHVWLLLCCCFPLVASWIALNPKIPPQRRRSLQPATSLAATLNGIATAGIPSQELGPVQKAVTMACQDQEVIVDLSDMFTMEAPIGTTVLGATGRAMLLKASTDLSEDEMFDLQCAISQEMDELIYSNPPALSQPILLSIKSNLPESLSHEEIVEMLANTIEHEVQEYEMNVALPCNPESPVKAFIPSSHVEVDGAQVTGPDGNTFWDTSTLLVFDNLVTDDLRKRLLDVVLGREDDDGPAWNDAKNGPDPRRWARGGLLDVPEEQETATETYGSEEDGRCWGLREEAIAELCFEHHGAFQEFETTLSDLFPQFTVSRFPEAVLGSDVSPLTANAATFGDHFDWHIDADPNLTPPSPWTDVYGRYPNRCPEKPRFMSCLIYLRDWNEEEWGAPTRFLDVATDTPYDVQAKPGRVVIMDQDITHTVVAPLEAAGKCPRYSLVWKLILHPQETGQDMTDLAWQREWPEPVLLGSAAAKPTEEIAGAM